MAEIGYLKGWIGRTERAEDRATPSPLAGLAALLDHREPPWRVGELPPLAHWLYFLPRAPQSELDADGHPQRGGFLPPVDLPQRMYAGARISFHAPIAVDAKMERVSTIAEVAEKCGASGRMVFVTVRHEILAAGAPALTEEQDVVYREAGSGAAAAEIEGRSPDSVRRIVPDPVLLFRFSALTFNAHRIHYDRDYATAVEGYPGLVVQGPLIATLLLDHFLRAHPGAAVRRFSFRARRPLFETAPFELCLRHQPGGAGLWARDGAGAAAMTAEVEAG
ncbi:MAG: MaoC family dehydratase N-terminal domain-containing protein [Alphaproteobacteria bacterium]|nr:MaoC family dehydratase N-terminal domain-containing protein [Alphaproteobacteria bacterium]MDE2011666.1 MaoC family dehydratase N-terminal domain-containing protein [Alphaproteobacteria bacterium]MDE2075065.1 MaoC family dehydratase N-terminal domain-containing protein [Alphaproteobacteria bacterium]